jgi:cyclic lactone autoinducer peptide
MKKCTLAKLTASVCGEVATFVATISAPACLPLFTYQPKAPKSLIKND